MKYEEIADHLQRHTRQLQAFEEAADLLRSIGSMEQNIAEQKDRLARLGEDCAAAERARDKAIAEAEAAKKQAEKVLFDAEVESKLIRVRATTRANDEAATLTAGAAAEVEAANLMKAEAEAKTAIARGALEATQTELAAVNARLASAKASVQTLLGAGT